MSAKNQNQTAMTGAGGGLRSATLICFALGLAGVLMAAAGAFVKPELREQFYFSYQTAFAYCLTLSLGALFITMIQHLCKWRAIVVLRRLGELVMANFWVLALMFIPTLFWMDNVYEWSAYETEQAVVSHDGGHAQADWLETAAHAAGDAHGEAHAAEAAHGMHDAGHGAADAHAGGHHANHLLDHKAPYLNKKNFKIRAVIYFLIWFALSRYFFRNSKAQDETGDPVHSVKMRSRAALGVLLFALSGTFACFDWLMSLDYMFFSTVWGVYIFGGAMTATFSLLVLMAAGLGMQEPLLGRVSTEHFHDLGKMMFAFTIFWAYIAFSQFMLIWYANIPEETEWFQPRIGGYFTGDGLNWRLVSYLLVFGHFVLPFFLLLPRSIKRTVPLLAFIAIWMLVMHFVDLYWIVMPTLDKADAMPHWMDLALLVGLLGLFMAAVLRRAQCTNLLAKGDPFLKDSVRFENI